MEENTDRSPLLDQTQAASSSEVIEVQPPPLGTGESRSSGYKLRVFGACLNTLVHSLIGGGVFVTLWFAFKSTPVSSFQLHIGLCVIGYQLLMSHAILCLSAHNGWSAALSLAHRRRVHWVLQLAGSGAAAAGSAIMIKQKPVHFNTVHGKLALAALVFTCLSLINGVMSLYAVELRRFVPVKVFKISHIVLGAAAFGLSSACLAFGYNKGSFKEWASQEFAYVMIGVTCTYTFIIIITPSFTVWKKMCDYFKNKIC